MRLIKGLEKNKSETKHKRLFINISNLIEVGKREEKAEVVHTYGGKNYGREKMVKPL